MSIRRQFTVATVADLYLSNPQDDDVYTTRGYSQEGVGGNAYRYDASSVAAVDYEQAVDLAPVYLSAQALQSR